VLPGDWIKGSGPLGVAIAFVIGGVMAILLVKFMHI